jgi:hypothetical protein
MLLVVVACSSDGEDPGLRAVDGTTTSPPELLDDGAPGPDPETSPAGEDPSATPPDGSAAAPGAPTTSTVRAAPAPEPAPAPGGVGAFAGFYLREQLSARLVLDIRSQSGAEPSSGTVDHVRGVLSQVSGKDVRVGGGALAGEGRQWSADEIRALADSVGPAQSRDAAVVRLLYLRGGFAGDDTVLGVAVRSDVAAVFADRIDDAAGPLGNRSRIEDAITVHEVGHLLGLVDLVLDRGRADPDHPGHSRNRNSVMYYAVESTLVGSILTGGPPTEFDAEDLADLAAIRSGEEQRGPSAP